MKSFKKNFLTVGLAILLVLAGSWLVGVPQHKLVDGMTLVIATMVMTLVLEDFWRKALTQKELLSWQYFVGMLIMSSSVLAWLWASESYTNKEMVIRLAATFLFGGLGAWWVAIPYRRSVTTTEEQEQRRAEAFKEKEAKKWKRWQRKIKEADLDDAIDYLHAHLRFALIDDNLDSLLDFSRPLIVVSEDESVLTYDEAISRGLKDKAAVADDYITLLLR